MPDTDNTAEDVEGGLKRLGEIRDGLLVSATLLYALGYMIRSFNAWWNDLGMLPAIEAQYFIAGFGPALILVVVYRLLRKTQDVVRRLRSSLTQISEEVYAEEPSDYPKDAHAINRIVSSPKFKTQKRKLQTLVGVGLTLPPLIVLVFLIGFHFIYKRPNELAVIIAASCLIVLLYIAIVLDASSPTDFFIRAYENELISEPAEYCSLKHPNMDLNDEQMEQFHKDYLVKQRRRLSRLERFGRFQKGSLYILPTAFGIVSLILYAYALYPKIPQEFGGPKFRLAYIDIAKVEVSPKTLSALMSSQTKPHKAASRPLKPPETNNDVKVVRSDLVEVYFSGDEYMLVRLVRPYHAQDGSQVYEIPKGAIKDVIWVREQSKP